MPSADHSRVFGSEGADLSLCQFSESAFKGLNTKNGTNGCYGYIFRVLSLSAFE